MDGLAAYHQQSCLRRKVLLASLTPPSQREVDEQIQRDDEAIARFFKKKPKRALASSWTRSERPKPRAPRGLLIAGLGLAFVFFARKLADFFMH